MAKKKTSAKKVRRKIKKSKRASLPSFPIRKHLLPLAICMVAALALYIQTYDFEYTLDDLIVVTENNFTKQGLAGIDDIFTTEYFVGYFGEQKDLIEGGRYRPLSVATFALEYEFFGEDPMPSHIVNVLLYLLTLFLVYRTLHLFFPKNKTGQWWFSLVFVGTLLYALHPVHSEVVANIKGRDEILSFIFSLASLIFAVRYGFTGKIKELVASALLFFVGLFAKENTVTFLAVIPLSVYFFTPASLKRNLTAFAPLFAGFVIYLMIRTSITGGLGMGKEITDLLNNPFAEMNISEKYATIFYTLLEYVRLLFAPHSLTHDYYPYHVPIMNWGMALPWLSLILYLAMGLFALWGLRSKNIYAYCIAFFLITISIASNIVFTIGTFMNERFLFAPSFAFALLMGYLVQREIPRRISNEALSKGLRIALIAGYSIWFIWLNVERIPAWRNNLTLNLSSIQVSEGSTRANCFTGTALFKEYQKETDPERKKELLAECDEYFERSLEIYPIYKNSLQMKAGVLAEQFKYDGDLDKLLTGFYRILRIRQIDYIDQYLQYLNGRSAQKNMLINFYLKIGHEYYGLEKARYDLAEKYLRYAEQVQPGEPRVRQAFCDIYRRMGDQSKAAQYCGMQ